MRLRDKTLEVPYSYVESKGSYEEGRKSWLDFVNLKIRVVLRWFRSCCEDEKKFEKLCTKLTNAEADMIQKVMAKIDCEHSDDSQESPSSTSTTPKKDPSSSVASTPSISVAVGPTPSSSVASTPSISVASTPSRSVAPTPSSVAPTPSRSVAPTPSSSPYAQLLGSKVRTSSTAVPSSVPSPSKHKICVKTFTSSTVTKRKMYASQIFRPVLLRSTCKFWDDFDGEVKTQTVTKNTKTCTVAELEECGIELDAGTDENVIASAFDFRPAATAKSKQKATAAQKKNTETKKATAKAKPVAAKKAAVKKNLAKSKAEAVLKQPLAKAKASKKFPPALCRYNRMFQKNNHKAAIRRALGDQKQMFVFGGWDFDKEELWKVAGDCVERLNNKTLLEADAKKFCTDAIAVDVW